MDKQIAQLKAFNQSFNIDYASKPSIGTVSEAMLRHKLMAEENDEYLEAVNDNNLVEVADALGDQLYILVGTILKHGMQDVIEKVFDSIHESNMTKLDVTGLPIYREDGKILKGPNFKPVNLKPLFNE